MPKYKQNFRQLDGDPLPRYVHPIVGRDGLVRTYFRRGDEKGTIHGALLRGAGRVQLSPKWWDEYNALKHRQPLPGATEDEIVAAGGIVPGSWDALIAHFTTQSPKWLVIRPVTQRRYRRHHMLISKLLGPLKVAKTLDAIQPLIHKKQFGDAATGTEAAPMEAKALRTVFHILCEHARRQPLAWIATNPVADIEKPKTKNKDGLHTCTEAEVAAWRRAHPDYASDVRAFFEMGLAWGARASDLLTLGWSNIAEGVICFTPNKTRESTGAIVHLEVRGEHLEAVLAARPQGQTYFFQKPPAGSNQYARGNVVTLKPEARSYSWLKDQFPKWRAEAGVEKVIPHSLRKLFATRMANAGASLTDIADALGDTEESAKIYVAKRDKKQGAQRAQRFVDAAA